MRNPLTHVRRRSCQRNLSIPARFNAYLEAAIEDGDQGVLILALRRIAQARGGVAAIARRSKLTREATYRMLSKSGNPELRSFTAILGAAGLRWSVKPIDRRLRKAPDSDVNRVGTLITLPE